LWAYDRPSSRLICAQLIAAGTASVFDFIEPKQRTILPINPQF
jgi:hypothetical protein